MNKKNKVSSGKALAVYTCQCNIKFSVYINTNIAS